MNCRDFETLLLAERDGVLTPEEHATLDRHLAGCPECRQLRSQLSSALAAYRADSANAPLPDVDQEWQKLRARLDRESSRPGQKRRLAPVIWFAAPLAAAAALALAYLRPSIALPPATSVVPAAAEVAQAEYVEAGNADASTMVYVDKDSGWLVVWATDADTASSG